MRAAGACVAAVEAVARGDHANAYCLVRPPGHHAIANMPMGFCFFNSVAIAAAHARQALGLDRVAIVDIDIHHGNGTQDAFYSDPSVLYVSTHQYPYYPGSGHWRETGAGAGVGATLNVPLPAGCGNPEYDAAFQELILPALRRFQPHLILVSAGYDAHWADPVDGAEMRLSCAGYASLIREVKAVADELCEGRSDSRAGGRLRPHRPVLERAELDRGAAGRGAHSRPRRAGAAHDRARHHTPSGGHPRAARPARLNAGCRVSGGRM